MPFQKKSQTRLTFLSVLMVLVMIFYTFRTYQLQMNSTEFKDADDGATMVLTSVLKAPRGEILDCYGRQIAINRDGYNVVFNKAYIKDNLNDVILTLVNLFRKNDVEWTDELPITKKKPYKFIKDGDTEKLIEKLELAHYATAQNCVDEMVTRYGLEDYTEAEQRRIIGVRYSMDISDFSISYPFTLAEDIPSDLMLKISESSFLLSGVTVDVVPVRQYVDTSLAVNLIGTVGPIFKEDWEEYKEKGYSYNDKVGKSGVEAWGEKYLRGTDGEITYRLDSEGNIISKKVTKEPIAGKTVMLTIDKSMQRIAQDSIAKTVKKLQSEGGTAVAGAAVVVDIKNGNVAVSGWLEDDGISYRDFLAKMQEYGVKTIICTDITKDGAMQGTNRELYREISNDFSFNVIASGGVSSIDDVRALSEMNLYGAIIGKALYNGGVELAEAVRIADGIES